MSKQANRTMIGIFVLGAIGLALAAVLLLGSGKLFRKTYIAVCYFEGSVGGLSVGAPVVFRGVRVGSVKDVVLRYDPTSLSIQIPVYIEIDPRKGQLIGPHPKTLGENLKPMIDRGLRAQLEMQSIVTGQMQVGLDFHPGKPAKLLGHDTKYPEIPTIPTPLQELTKKIGELPLEEIIKNIGTAVEGINRVVNSPEITKTIQSISQATEEAKSLIKTVQTRIDPTVSKIDATVTDAGTLMQNLNSQIQPISSDVQQTLREAQKLLREIDAKASTLTSSIDGTTKDVQKLVQNIDKQVEPLGPSIQKTLASIERTSEEAGVTLRQAEQTLAVLEGDIGEDSEMVYELKKTVKEVGAAVKAIQNLAKALEQQPESLLFGKKKRTGR